MPFTSSRVTSVPLVSLSQRLVLLSGIQIPQTNYHSPQSLHKSLILVSQKDIYSKTIKRIKKLAFEIVRVGGY